MTRLVEIRVYTLNPGSGEAFHRLVTEVAVPMLQRSQIDVVAYGPSLHDGNSYYLIRSYGNLQDRRSREDAFYGGHEWREGPRETILALIDTYSEAVVEMEDGVVASLHSLVGR